MIRSFLKIVRISLHFIYPILDLTEIKFAYYEGVILKIVTKRI